MTATYTIEREKSLVRIRLAGAVDGKEIVELVRKLAQDPDLERGLNVLSDHSELDDAVDAETVKAMIPWFEKLGERVGPYRLAIVAPRPASYGMARMSRVLAGPTPADVRPFRELSEAEKWLRGH